MLWPWKNCPDRKSFQERTTLSELTNDSPTAGYMTYNTPVEVTRKLRKVGGSVMVPLPPEILQEAGLVVDATVVIRSRQGHVEIEPEAAPDQDAMGFMDSFLAEYGDAMEKLSKR